MVRAAALALGLSLLVLAACGRPIDRPLSGALPPAGPYTPVPIGWAEAPPTLAPPTVIPLAPDAAATPGPAPTPTPPAGGQPILRDLQPPQNAQVSVGELRVSARIVGFSSLAEVTATLDGQPVAVSVAAPDERNWTAFFSREFDPGEYEVRIVARDDHDRAGGFRWQFEVVESQELRVESPESRVES